MREDFNVLVLTLLWDLNKLHRHVTESILFDCVSARLSLFVGSTLTEIGFVLFA
jgi:hypothetical protein